MQDKKNKIFQICKTSMELSHNEPLTVLEIYSTCYLNMNFTPKFIFTETYQTDLSKYLNELRLMQTTYIQSR